ncbi:MAG: hypothetical protein ACI9VR_003056 [Cognaticolwellia sp.]|jgi:hypothetical protein
MPSSKTSRFLVALLLTVCGALLTLPALAARAPDAQRARIFVELLLGELAGGVLDSERQKQLFWPSLDGSLHPAAKRAWFDELSRKLAAGELAQTLRANPEVGAIVAGPDYVRVVLDTRPVLSTRVSRVEGSLRALGFEPAVCQACTEQERFVVALLARVQRHRKHRSLTVGADLWLDPAAEYPQEPPAFLLAWHNRNVDAGYLRWVLQDAVLAGSQGSEVQVALRDRTETWTLRYREGRWMLDYASLPLDSPLRLDPDQVEDWRNGELLEEAAVGWWLPSWREQASGLVVGEDLLFVSPRAVQGDLVVYGQALDRSYAILALLDPESGSVNARFSLPTLSRQQNFSQRSWRDLFHIALSPDGRLIAIGAWDRMWVVRVDDGEVLSERYALSGLDLLAWSPDGSRLLAADHLVLLDLEPSTLRESQRIPLAKPLVDLSWSYGQVWTVDRLGEVKALDALDLSRSIASETACCGGVLGCELDPGSGELLVSCSAVCEPAWLWVWDGSGEPMQLADETLAAPSGALALDPTGRYLVTPADGRAAAVYDRREERASEPFGLSIPLRQAAWSSDGATLYGVDMMGTAWAWSLSHVLEQP